VPMSFMATCFGALVVDSVVIEKGAPFALHTQVAIALHKGGKLLPQRRIRDCAFAPPKPTC
jgi:hypothetical protein